MDQDIVITEMFSAYLAWATEGDDSKLLAFMKTQSFQSIFGEVSRLSYRESIAVFSVRKQWIKTFGFSVPLPVGIQAINSLGPILEIAAGSGFLSKLISATGGNVVATDPAPLSYCAKREGAIKSGAPKSGGPKSGAPNSGVINPGVINSGGGPTFAHLFLPIRKIDAKTAITDDRGERSVLLSWPSYDLDWCEGALDAIFPGQNLALVGEGYGGCTGTDRMFEILDKDFVPFSMIDGAPKPGGASYKEIAQKGSRGFARFPGINDSLKFYRKK